MTVNSWYAFVISRDGGRDEVWCYASFVFHTLGTILKGCNEFAVTFKPGETDYENDRVGVASAGYAIVVQLQ